MAETDPSALVRARALRYLEGREHSRREVESRLRRYGHDDELVADTIRWLEEIGYVDDRRFACTYAREKTRSGWGPHRIRAGLSAAGVPQSVIANALETAAAEAGEAGEGSADENLAALVRRRFARDRERDPDGTARRAAAFLQRRGHDWDTTRRVLRAAFGDGEEQGFR